MLPAPDFSRQEPRPELLFLRIRAEPATLRMHGAPLTSLTVVNLERRLSSQPLFFKGSNRKVLKATRAAMGCDLTTGWAVHAVEYDNECGDT